MKKTIIILAIGTFALIGACNTIEGFGKDVKGTGNVISETAQDAKPN